MRHRPERRVTHRQADLFELPPDRPRWPDLPHDTRATLTTLLARLLGDQRQEPATRHPEVEHE